MPNVDHLSAVMKLCHLVRVLYMKGDVVQDSEQEAQRVFA